MSLGALQVGASGLNARNTDIRVIANNIANAGTSGFKADRPVFEDMHYQVMRQPGASSSETTELPSGYLMGSGVKVVATQKDFGMGSLVTSDAPLDMAINGGGMFQVLRPDGQMAYTRDGRFQLSSSGQLVTASGYIVQPAITVPAQSSNIVVGIDGAVTAVAPGETTPTSLGSLTLAQFGNPVGLQPIGENFFIETNASGAPTVVAPGSSGTGTLSQGAYEASNVNIVHELVRLIEAQRGYEMNAKTIESVNGMMQYVNQMF
jgi:flagellar basal-body rod protein FlgG